MIGAGTRAFAARSGFGDTGGPPHSVLSPANRTFSSTGQRVCIRGFELSYLVSLPAKM